MTQALGQHGVQSLMDSATRGPGGAPWGRGGAALIRYPANNTGTDQKFFATKKRSRGAAKQDSYMLEAIALICAGKAAELLHV